MRVSAKLYLSLDRPGGRGLILRVEDGVSEPIRFSKVDWPRPIRTDRIDADQVYISHNAASLLYWCEEAKESGKIAAVPELDEIKSALRDAWEDPIGPEPDRRRWLRELERSREPVVRACT